jgi:hypothetical protein
VSGVTLNYCSYPRAIGLEQQDVRPQSTQQDVWGLTSLLPRFEKSLYDLIRGLRNHKGNEKEYIQNSLKECRAEIRGQDMG